MDGHINGEYCIKDESDSTNRRMLLIHSSYLERNSEHDLVTKNEHWRRIVTKFDPFDTARDANCNGDISAVELNAIISHNILHFKNKM